MNKSMVLLVAASLSATGAYAAAASAGASGDVLEEIVVTAQKREESAQKTPVSMNLYTAQDVVQKGIVDLQTLSQVDTSLTFNRNGGAAALALRGVTNTTTTELGNPSVPVSIDNFTVNRAPSLDTTLFDVARVEVLRGPQGTLFGRSATGGLVNITTARPGKEYESAASLEFGNYSTINATGMLNLPISDSFQLRAAASSRKRGGFRTNTFSPVGSTPGRGDDEDSQAGRLGVAFQAGEKFDAWLSFQQINMSGVGPVVQSLLFKPNPDPVKAAAGDIDHGPQDLGDSSAFPVYGAPFQLINDKTFKWEFNLHALPGGATLSYVGGVDSLDFHNAGASLTFFGFLSPNNDFLPVREFMANQHPVTQNHELRLTSAAGGSFNWQAGLYYFSEKNSLFSHGDANPGTATDVTLIAFNYDVDTKAKAAYAQGSWSATENGKLTVGARYSKDEVERSGLFQLPLFGVSSFSDNSYSGSKTTWHLGYDYTPSATQLLYAKLSSGYKPGGFESCANYKPENVTTGELGSKNRFDSDRIQLNGAAFYSQYKDQQVQQFVSTCATGSVTTNAGKSTIYGVEADFKAVLAKSNRVDIGLTYLHAKYDDFKAPPTVGVGGLQSCTAVAAGANFNCDFSGNTLPVSPAVTLAAGYEHDFAAGPGNVNLRVEARYTSKQYFDPSNYGDMEQDSYTLVNAFLSYAKDNWKLGLFGRNLGDKTYLNYAAENTTGGAHQYNYSYGFPRTFGLRAEIHLR